MCVTCGCATHEAGGDHVHHPSHDGDHDHAADHHHDDGRASKGSAHVQPHRGTEPLSRRTTVTIEREILAHNAELARENRRWLSSRDVFTVNFMSSPGSGKTTLLERMIRDRVGGRPMTVIEGDQATDNDARRIRAAGCRAVQVNTGAGCHLDAAMIGRALRALEPPPGSILAIENVGNLVCPALFDLGEDAKVVVASVTEGEDKPAKYPHVFHASEAVVLNKTDLLPHVHFDVDRFTAHVHEVNPVADVLCASALRAEGLAAFDVWLRARMERRRS